MTDYSEYCVILLNRLKCFEQLMRERDYMAASVVANDMAVMTVKLEQIAKRMRNEGMLTRSAT